MEPVVKRKFKSDICPSSIDKMIEKRQRKRNFMTRKKPYSVEQEQEQFLCRSKPLSFKIGQTTVIRDIPLELLPKYKHLRKEHQQREFEKPEHWIMPKQEPKVSRVDNLRMEEDNILKNIERRAVWDLAARKLIEARKGHKISQPTTSKLTAKGYLSRRAENNSSEQRHD